MLVEEPNLGLKVSGHLTKMHVHVIVGSSQRQPAKVGSVMCVVIWIHK